MHVFSKWNVLPSNYFCLQIVVVVSLSNPEPACCSSCIMLNDIITGVLQLHLMDASYYAWTPDESLRMGT